MPLGDHEIMQRGIPQPHQLKLERRILRSLKMRDRELNKLVVKTSPVQNFRFGRPSNIHLETRNKEPI